MCKLKLNEKANLSCQVILPAHSMLCLRQREMTITFNGYSAIVLILCFSYSQTVSRQEIRTEALMQKGTEAERIKKKLSLV